MILKIYCPPSIYYEKFQKDNRSGKNNTMHKLIPSILVLIVTIRYIFSSLFSLTLLTIQFKGKL